MCRSLQWKPSPVARCPRAGGGGPAAPGPSQPLLPVRRWHPEGGSRFSRPASGRSALRAHAGSGGFGGRGRGTLRPWPTGPASVGFLLVAPQDLRVHGDRPSRGHDSPAAPHRDRARGPGGPFFREGDAEELAAMLVRLADDPTLRARLGASGRERVVARYSWAAHCAQVESVLERVLGTRP
ncbi:MAG TPA: glycosyltransferase [Vicinamibacteria bacterium]